MDNFSGNQIAVTAVLGILALVGLVSGEIGFAILMGILTGVYVNREMEENRQRESREEQRYQQEHRRRSNDNHRREQYNRHFTTEDDPFADVPMREIPRPAHAEQVHKHALDAVRRAGMNPNSVQVLPVDMGFLTFRDNENPVIHRTVSLADDSDYIQPFVQLRVPVMAQGRIKFELFDSAGNKVYAHEDKYQLERGRNLIIPATRLPVHDEQDMDGKWSLRISADDTLLAEHRIGWEESASDEFRRYLSDDGEISHEIRAMVVDSSLQDMSLDDLLAHQDDDNQQLRG